MKKIVSTLAIACLLLPIMIPSVWTLASPEGPDYLSAYWPGFRGAADFKGLTDAKTPTSAAETSLKWSCNTGGDWATSSPGFPIEVGEFVYFAVGNKILKLNKETGVKAAESAEAVDTVGFFSTIAYGDGKIFMPVNGGRIQAFDAQTLASVWVSQACPLSGMQSLSPVTYHNGYMYMGVSNGPANNGMLFCLSTSDDDPFRSDEVKNYTWSYNPGSTGFYWSEGVPVGENIIFAGENGVLVSHHLTRDVVTDTLTLTKNNGTAKEAVRSSAHYDKDTKRVYVSTKAGSVHSVRINADGTFDTASYNFRFISNDLTSSPTTYRGRLYIGGGGISSAAPFSVLDAETLSIIYQIPQIKSQSSPVVSTAYATAQNNWKVYIYLLQYTGTPETPAKPANPDRIFCVTDSAGQTTASYTELALSPNIQYNSSSLAAGRDGTLYYKNDYCRVFAFKNTNGAYTYADVINAIDRLPVLDKLTTADGALLRLTGERYEALTPAEKEKVTNTETLTAALGKMDALSDTAAVVAKLISGIEALPGTEALTIVNNAAVQSLLEIYYALSEEDRLSVTNINVLMAAKTKIEGLAETRRVAGVEAKITALPAKVAMNAKSAIENALAAYNDLPAELRGFVSNAVVLQSLSEQMNALETEIKGINDGIWALNPRNITLKDKPAIEDLIARYNRLSEADRAYVEYFYEALEFKAVIDGLEGTAYSTGDAGNRILLPGITGLSLWLLITFRRKKQRGRALWGL